MEGTIQLMEVPSEDATEDEEFKTRKFKKLIRIDKGTRRCQPYSLRVRPSRIPIRKKDNLQETKANAGKKVHFNTCKIIALQYQDLVMSTDTAVGRASDSKPIDLVEPLQMSEAREPGWPHHHHPHHGPAFGPNPILPANQPDRAPQDNVGLNTTTEYQNLLVELKALDVNLEA